MSLSLFEALLCYMYMKLKPDIVIKFVFVKQFKEEKIKKTYDKVYSQVNC